MAKRRTLTWVVATAVVVLAVGIAIYRYASKGSALKPLVWGGPTNISMLPIIAQQKGFFQAEGLDVRPNYLQTGKVAMDAVVSGDPVSYTHLDVYKRQAPNRATTVREWCRIHFEPRMNTDEHR